MPLTVTFSMCPYRDTWVISQNASAALKYMSGVGAEPRPPRLGPSSEANVIGLLPLRLTVASLRNGVTRLTSASNTISRVWILGSSPSGTIVIIAPFASAVSRGSHQPARDPRQAVAARGGALDGTDQERVDAQRAARAGQQEDRRQHHQHHVRPDPLVGHADDPDRDVGRH